MMRGDIYMLDTDTLSYLRIDEIPQTTRFAYDEYGKARKEYLKYEYPNVYEKLKAENKLELHLAYIDKICWETEEELTPKMRKAEGITEELKARDMMEWVGRAKNLRNRIREIVRNDIVYTAYADEEE